MMRLQSISEIHELLGGGPPRHPLISVIDLSKIGLGEEALNQSLVIDLYSITLKTRLSAPMKYGREYFDFDTGTLLCAEPGQVFVAENAFEKGDLEGWVLYFHPDLLIKHKLYSGIRNYGFFAYEINEALHLSNAEKDSLSDIVSKIELELSQNIDEFSQDIQLANIDLLLKYIDRYFNRQFLTRKHLNQQILDKVNHILDQYYSGTQAEILGLPSVHYLAERVFLSPNYMSDLLKKETGLGAQEIIHNYILKLAKYRLLNSQSTIAEISHTLGFEYQQYFSRMFKHHVGLTPKEFRNAH